MNDTLTKILKLPIPPELKSKDILEAIRHDFGIWETYGFKSVYDSSVVTEFKNVDELKAYLRKLGVPNIQNKHLGILLEHWYETLSTTKKNQEVVTEEPAYTGESRTKDQPAGTTLEGKLEELQEIQESEEKQRSETAKSDQVIKNVIAKKKEIAEKKLENERVIKQNQQLEKAYKDKKIYARFEETEKPTLTKTDKESLDNLKKQAQTDSVKFGKDAYDTIKNKLAKDVPPEVSPQEADLDFKKAAIDLTNSLTGKPESSPPVQTALYSSVANNPDILNKIVGDPTAAGKFVDIATMLTDSQTPAYLLSQRIIQASFGSDFQQATLPNLSISLSSAQAQGYEEFSLDQLTSKHNEILNQQNGFLDQVQDLGDFGVDKVKASLVSRANLWMNSQMSQLGATSKLAGIYNSKLVQFSLSSFGLGQPVNWIATNSLGRFAESFGMTGTFGWIGEFSGLNFGVVRGAAPAVKEGVKQIGAQAGKQAATQVAKAGGAIAVKKGVGGLISKIATVLGIGTGWTNFGISTAIGLLVGKIAEKIDWTKVKKAMPYILGILVGGPVFILGGPLLGLGTGFLVFGALRAGSLAAGGTLAISSFVGGFRFIFRNLIGPALIAPIAITLLVLPVLVAFIMFVINSGAYIVPPSPSSQVGKFGSPYVDITKTPSPSDKFENSVLSSNQEITYTINIKPKKGNLLNVNLTYDCKVISRSISTCPDIVLDDANKDIFSKQLDSISATGLSFTYTASYDSQFEDSAVIDSIILSASTENEPRVEAEVSASVTFGTPPISCPVPGAKVASPQFNYSLNQSANTGHGSQIYWEAMGQSPSAYALPQGSGCHSASECSYYGYAYDVFPTGTKEVFAPTVEGKDVTWQCSYGFVNKNSGHTYICSGSGYTLVLTHMANGAKTGTIDSGERIGTLFNQGNNTHLHIEFSINGRWQKPENYFCQ